MAIASKSPHPKKNESFSGQFYPANSSSKQLAAQTANHLQSAYSTANSALLNCKTTYDSSFQVSKVRISQLQSNTSLNKAHNHNTLNSSGQTIANFDRSCQVLGQYTQGFPTNMLTMPINGSNYSNMKLNLQRKNQLRLA